MWNPVKELKDIVYFPSSGSDIGATWNPVKELKVPELARLPRGLQGTVESGEGIESPSPAHSWGVL